MSVRIHVVDTGSAKHVAGRYTQVFIVTETDGVEERIDISNNVRSVSTRVMVGEPVMATIEVYLASFKTDATVEEAIIHEFVRPRFYRLRRVWREITGGGMWSQRWTA